MSGGTVSFLHRQKRVHLLRQGLLLGTSNSFDQGGQQVIMQAAQLSHHACLALRQELGSGWVCLQEAAQGEACVSQVLHAICTTAETPLGFDGGKSDQLDLLAHHIGLCW